MNSTIPEPHVMPIDREKWKEKLSLCNFINAYYHYRDLVSVGGIKSVLLIGPGQGLEAGILRSRGFSVTTFDIDNTFRPDITGSVHDMTMFSNSQFDSVIASHVLEHLAEPYLDQSLSEISRIGRSALIYLPVAGRHMQFRWIAGFKNIDLTFTIDLFNYFRRHDGKSAKYCSGQHYWEIGVKGFRKKEITQRIRNHFEILHKYRNKDWPPSYNFVLKSKSFK
ncbi:MAG: methyltransferase domain-containing protein [Gammaproteobacteria bacterium]|nr:methyltransferase domain-containing protein [Gammaproteobacteria bacterium]